MSCKLQVASQRFLSEKNLRDLPVLQLPAKIFNRRITWSVLVCFAQTSLNPTLQKSGEIKRRPAPFSLVLLTKKLINSRSLKSNANDKMKVNVFVIINISR